MTSNKRLTRRQLYDLVWSTPMIRLAEQFGISDVGLKKTCERHRVPTPSRGYWAQIQAGQKPKKAAFAEAADKRLDQIEIGGGTDLPEPVQQVLADQRERRKLERPKAPKSPRPPAEIEVVVNVHLTLQISARALRRFKVEDTFVEATAEGMCGATVGCASVERVIFVLDRLAQALDAKQMPMICTGKAMQVAVGRDSVTFTLSERTQLVPHVPTPAELAEEARRKEQLERHYRNPSRWPRPPYGSVYPSHDTVWTGELTIQIDGYGDGVRRRWSDGRLQRLENVIPSIVDGIEVLLAARKARREANEERERQRNELAYRHDLFKKRREREEARHKFLERVIRLTNEAEILRSWLGRTQLEVGVDADSQTARMIEWTREKLRKIEGQLNTDGVERHLGDATLFPNPASDELADPLGDPPPMRWY
ncbi:hypothetical protein ACMDCR_10245 [Labrys okinawensis]|uniref:hypothetical protein n=1 Tax=Labrys okinawensis TaxID=346911 RepID=UPI0039BD123E